jgi:hypothetical protein
MSIRRVRTVFTGVAGTPWYANMYFDADGVTPTPQENVDDTDAFWTAMAGVIDNNVSWTVGPEVPVIDETTGTLTGVTSVTAGTGSGTATADPLPYATQGLIRLATDDFVAGRRVKGRIFVPGVVESSSSTTAVPDATFMGILQTAVDGLIAAGGFLVWARPFAGAAGPPVRPAREGSKASISGASVWTQWAVMRSRRD